MDSKAVQQSPPPMMEQDDESEELNARLQDLRMASNDGLTSENDVVFGNLTITIKDVKAFKIAGLSLLLRVVYPKVYQTAIPDQHTSKIVGSQFLLHNITTEGAVVLEFFKGMPVAVKALRKALSKRVGMVKLQVAKLAEGEHTMWLPIVGEKSVTDFGVPQLQLSVKFNKKTSVSIDDFELLKLLGRGKFGKVFLASQRATGKIYAIKTIRKQDLNSNAVDVHHTLVERLILSSVEHPFICNLKFAFQDRDKVYFVLQYIEGGELMYHVHCTGKPLEMARVVFYAAELVLALDYLHSRNVIYRDLKPENVLIDKDGNVRLTDFGLSKIAKSKTHSICGTPQFLAPEMILYAKTVGYDHMVDWWALGIVIHEMASCQLPFDDENHQQLYRKIVYEHPVYPFYFTDELVDLMEGLLTKDPGQRLGQSADDLKSHPFFQSINWEKLEAKELEPPFVPKLKKATDTAYFYKSFTTADKKDSVALINIAQDTQDRFRNFSFTNLTELTGDAAADGTLDAGSPDDRPPLILPSDDELARALLKKPAAKQPEFVITHKNPLQALPSGDKAQAKRLLLHANESGPECPKPPFQLSVHPWPWLMTEAPEHSCWQNVQQQFQVADEDQWWGGPQEPSQALCVGSSMVCWVEDCSGRWGNPQHCYVLCDAKKKMVSAWHGPESTPAMRGRATRVMLMWAAELGYARHMCPVGALKGKFDVHKPRESTFPRSLEEGRHAAPDPDLVPFTDGRALAWLWCAATTTEEKRREACNLYFPGRSNVILEIEHSCSTVFRAHFRMMWGEKGDVGLKKVKAKRRYVARRPFEASCNVNDTLQVLGEGEVPHWCYVFNMTSHARGVLPLAAWNDDECASLQSALSPRGGDEAESKTADAGKDTKSRTSAAVKPSRTASGHMRSKSGTAASGLVDKDRVRMPAVPAATTAETERQGSPRAHSGELPAPDSSVHPPPVVGDGADSLSPRGSKTPLLNKLQSLRQSRKERRSRTIGAAEPDISFPGIRLRVVDGTDVRSGEGSEPEPDRAPKSTSPGPDAVRNQDSLLASSPKTNTKITYHYECPQCEKVFSARGLLLEHLHAAAKLGGVCEGTPVPDPPVPALDPSKKDKKDEKKDEKKEDKPGSRKSSREKGSRTKQQGSSSKATAATSTTPLSPKGLLASPKTSAPSSPAATRAPEERKNSQGEASPPKGATKDEVVPLSAASSQRIVSAAELQRRLVTGESLRGSSSVSDDVEQSSDDEIVQMGV